MSKTLHSGWFRCRIRGLSKTMYPWIYYHVTIVGPKAELRREARYLAGLYLHRQVFDLECIHAPDQGMLTPIKTIDKIVFHYQNALAAVPDDARLTQGDSQ